MIIQSALEVNAIAEFESDIRMMSDLATLSAPQGFFVYTP